MSNNVERNNKTIILIISVISVVIVSIILGAMFLGQTLNDHNKNINKKDDDANEILETSVNNIKITYVFTPRT